MSERPDGSSGSPTAGPSLEFTMEHAAVNVPEPEAMAEWYVRKLGMTVARDVGGAAKAYFLADASGRVVMEIYSNPLAPVPDYANQDPLVLHFALFTDDVKAAEERLVAAGAAVHAGYMITPTGDELSMLRDPWGLAIQLVKRAEPML